MTEIELLQMQITKLQRQITKLQRQLKREKAIQRTVDFVEKYSKEDTWWGELKTVDEREEELNSFLMSVKEKIIKNGSLEKIE